MTSLRRLRGIDGSVPVMRSRPTRTETRAQALDDGAHAYLTSRLKTMSCSAISRSAPRSRRQPDKAGPQWLTLPGDTLLLVEPDDVASNDDRIASIFTTSEEDYRKLIDYLPVALSQVNLERRERGLRSPEGGGRDPTRGPSVDEHPELVELHRCHARDRREMRQAMPLFRGSSAADPIAPVALCLATTPNLETVMVATSRAAIDIEETKVAALDGTVQIDHHFTSDIPSDSRSRCSSSTMLDIGNGEDRKGSSANSRRIPARRAQFPRSASWRPRSHTRSTPRRNRHQCRDEPALAKRDDVSMSKLEKLTSRVLSKRGQQHRPAYSRDGGKHLNPVRTSLDLERGPERSLPVHSPDIELRLSL